MRVKPSFSKLGASIYTNPIRFKIGYRLNLMTAPIVETGGIIALLANVALFRC